MTYPNRIAMLSLHTSPLAALGGKETGGMNVYVRELSRELAACSVKVDVFTRNSERREIVEELLAPGARVIRIPAGPAGRLSKHQLYQHVPEFAAGIREWA